MDTEERLVEDMELAMDEIDKDLGMGPKSSFEELLLLPSSLDDRSGEVS